MFSFQNKTLFAIDIIPGYGATGKKQNTVIVKASYLFNAKGELTPIDATIQQIDEWWGKPGETSIRKINEVMPFKKGSEVLLQGTVHLPHPHYRVTDISLGIDFAEKTWAKTLRLYGPRTWKRRQFYNHVSYPSSFGSLALQYENAYGGHCARRTDKFFAANPVGKGFMMRDYYAENVPLPQIEYPDQLITRAGQRRIPACYAPLPLLWSPAAQDINPGFWNELHQGRYPEHLILPDDFYNTAPVDQQFETHFIGNEVIKLTGFLKELKRTETCFIPLPHKSPQVESDDRKHKNPVSLQLDTLHIDIDTYTLSLIWRGIAPDSPYEQVITLKEANL